VHTKKVPYEKVPHNIERMVNIPASPGQTNIRPRKIPSAMVKITGNPNQYSASRSKNIVFYLSGFGYQSIK
jgi:hypothetical protein